MECIKCKKTFDDQFAFCPFCGKRVTKKQRGADYNRALAWSVYPEYLLREDMEKMKGMGADEMVGFVKGVAEPPTIYKIQVRYYDSEAGRAISHNPLKWAGAWKEMNATKEQLSRLFAIDHASEIRAKPVDTVLTKSDIASKEDGAYFWTQEECQKAIDEVLKTQGGERKAV